MVSNNGDICLRKRQKVRAGYFRRLDKKARKRVVVYSNNRFREHYQNKGEEANYGCERAQLNHEKSQEVSSETHNKALSFVDHFLSVSDLGFCKNLKSEMTKKMASPPSLRSKGSQCLARKVSLAHDTGEQMPYDWTENHTEEDKNSDFGFKGEKFEHLPSVQESYNENLQENKYSANVLDVSSLKTNESEKIGSNSRNFTSCEDL
ncbi:hypothetical protein CASFOL_018195 [Castilleja foliolosa]|uniref:Uncharacterized protein n=1 Tax=Castilleja foliolosa TaxID=1961234 RepID=A0ABD3D7R7_9LAMI